MRKGWVHADLVPASSAASAGSQVGADWVVRFDAFGGNAYTSAASISLLESKLQTAKQWHDLLQQRDRQLEKSHTYLTRVSSPP